VRKLIDRKGNFVLHAPRQSGKTTTVLELARELTASGTYTAVVVVASAEVGAPFPDDPGTAERAFLERRAESDATPAQVRRDRLTRPGS